MSEVRAHYPTNMDQGRSTGSLLITYSRPYFVEELIFKSPYFQFSNILYDCIHYSVSQKKMIAFFFLLGWNENYGGSYGQATGQYSLYTVMKYCILRQLRRLLGLGSIGKY